VQRRSCGEEGGHDDSDRRRGGLLADGERSQQRGQDQSDLGRETRTLIPSAPIGERRKNDHTPKSHGKGRRAAGHQRDRTTE
jgi:hypothetical protein